MKRLCPACLTREGRVVAMDCPLCNGEGTVTLGEECVATFGPVVTAHAVSAALESVARAVDTPGVPNGTQRAALAETMALLSRSGITGPGRPPEATRAAADSLAAAAIGRPVQPLDVMLPEAPAYRYGPGERPGARGLPVLSADGHPSHLARICDPADALDTPTHQHAAEVRKREWKARALAAAIDERHP